MTMNNKNSTKNTSKVTSKKTSLTDNSYIKKMMPRKNSFYHQGVIKASQCKKLFESCKNDDIIYRSGLELSFIKWCESATNVIKWGSEPICIEYVSRLDNKVHRYYPDFIIYIKDKNNNEIRYIVEIKPYAQTIQPKRTASDWDKKTWIKNCDKWKYASEFVKKQKNMKFIIITEKFFGQ